MFNIDDRIKKLIAQHVSRVLVIDPNLATARLLTDVLKDLGVSDRILESTTTRALDAADDWAPQLILTELSAPGLDGLEFTHCLRRSRLHARKAGIIVISGDTREACIKAARDAGAHEFLGKPFTVNHIVRRVQNVVLKPRPWVEARMYIGPDRRRFNSGEFQGVSKRSADAQAAAFDAVL